MANQAKVKLYNQLIEEGLVELREGLKNVEVEFRRWHFAQVKNYVNALDVAYQWIVPNEEIEDDATIEGKVRQVEEEGKSTEIMEKVKQIFANVNIVDIFYEDETIPLSHLYSQSVIKE